MLTSAEITAKSEALCRLIDAKFGVKGGDLSRTLVRVGRRLPRRLRAQALLLLEAERMVAHPKLARQIDVDAVMQGYAEVVAYLKAIDVADRRKGVLLGIAGTMAFNVLLIAAAFVVWLWWRGYV